MSEVKCAKCGGEMQIGYLSNAPRWTEGKSLWSMPTARVYAYACRRCGYVELYLEQKTDAEKERIRQVSEDRGRNRLVRT